MEDSRPSLYLHVPTLLRTAPEYCWIWYKNSNNDGDYSDDNGYGDGDGDGGDGKYRAKELGRDRATILGASQDLSLKPSTTCTSFQMFYIVPHTLTTAQITWGCTEKQGKAFGPRLSRPCIGAQEPCLCSQTPCPAAKQL